MVINSRRIYTICKQHDIPSMRKSIILTVDFNEVNTDVCTRFPLGKYIEASCRTFDNIAKLPFGITYYVEDRQFILYNTNSYVFVFEDAEFMNTYSVSSFDFEMDTELYDCSNNYSHHLIPYKNENFPIKIKEQTLYVDKTAFEEHSETFRAALEFYLTNTDCKRNTIDSWNVNNLFPFLAREALHGCFLLEFGNYYKVTENNVGHLLEVASLLRLSVAFKKCITYFKMTRRTHFLLEHVILISMYLEHNDAVETLSHCNVTTLKSFANSTDWKKLEVCTQIAILGAIVTGPTIYR